MLICQFNEFIAVLVFVLALITAKGKQPAAGIFHEPAAVHMEIEYVGLATVINSFWKKEVTSVLIEGNWFMQNMKKKKVHLHWNYTNTTVS